MLTRKEAKIIEKRMKPTPPPQPKFQGKGTKARLNTAAEKMMFGRKSSI